MKAAVYAKKARAGVEMRTIAQAALPREDDPSILEAAAKSAGLLHGLVFLAVAAFFGVGGLLMRLLRWVRPSTPGPYGASPDRAHVLVRVHAVSSGGCALVPHVARARRARLPVHA